MPRVMPTPHRGTLAHWAGQCCAGIIWAWAGAMAACWGDFGEGKGPGYL